MSYGCEINNPQTWAHNPASYVFRLGTAEIWAGSKLALSLMASKCRLILRLNGDAIQGRAVIHVNDAARALLPKAVTDVPARPEISVKWDDFGVPDLSREWWYTLVAAIARIDGIVGLHCESGHGRTGTALAILYSLGARAGYIANGEANRCPVTVIRAIYDVNAVESAEQIEYICSMGIDVTALPRELIWNAGIKAVGVKDDPKQISDLKPYGSAQVDADGCDLDERTERAYNTRSGHRIKKTVTSPHSKPPRKGRK